MSSGHHFTGTGDWQAGLEVRIDSTGLSPHGALKLKSKPVGENKKFRLQEREEVEMLKETITW